MRTVIMYDTDFASQEAWNAFLDMCGVETTAVVAGRIIDRELTRVELNVTVAEASAE